MDEAKFSFKEIVGKLSRFNAGKADVVVAFDSDGLVPAAFLAGRLGKPLELLFSGSVEDTPSWRKHLLEISRVLTPEFTIKGKHVLLVDDVVRTGSMMQNAVDLLKRHGAKRVTTLAVAGNPSAVDYCLHPTKAYVSLPWQTFPFK